MLEIHKIPGITIPRLSNLLDISVSTIEKLLAKLKRDKIIERKGTKKTGVWIILKQDETNI